jgi:Xaa-Pro dipeptidase
VLAHGETALFDCAPVVEEYWGDSCSTVIVGEPADEVRRLHAVVLAALEAGIELLRPGVAIAEVDRTVRAVMAEDGYTYPHITGHGVGLKQQEAPIVTSDSHHVLAADTVIALEPGAYFAGYGVRLEHLVQVTEDGPRLLTDHNLALTTD